MARRRKFAGLPRGRTHRYEQYCSIARALDVIGDRWSLLLIRELMFAPKRYGDLLRALAGISTNLLADRLRRLERKEVVHRRRLPPPAGSVVYELTDRGRLLESVLYALSRFGAHYLGPPPKDLSLDAESWLFGMNAAFNPLAAAGLSETYEIHVDGLQTQIAVRGGRFEVKPGGARNPAVVAKAATGVFLALAARRLSVDRALGSGALELEGDRAVFARFVSLFDMSAPESKKRRAH